MLEIKRNTKTVEISLSAIRHTMIKEKDNAWHFRRHDGAGIVTHCWKSRGHLAIYILFFKYTF